MGEREVGGGGAQLSTCMEHVLPQHIRYNKLQHSNSNKSLELRKEKTMLNNWATKTEVQQQREKGAAGGDFVNFHKQHWNTQDKLPW